MLTTNHDSDFAAAWNALDRAERLRLRRLVRMGRSADTPELSRIASEYARWQMSRPWMRLFWLWFVPGMFLVLVASAQIHPVFLGVAIALGAQAVWAWFNLRKVARRTSAVTGPA